MSLLSDTGLPREYRRGRKGALADPLRPREVRGSKHLRNNAWPRASELKKAAAEVLWIALVESFG